MNNTKWVIWDFPVYNHDNWSQGQYVNIVTGDERVNFVNEIANLKVTIMEVNVVFDKTGKCTFPLTEYIEQPTLTHSHPQMAMFLCL